MPREHRYQVDLRWAGAEAGPTSSYQSYSREYVVEVVGKPPLRGSADPMFRGDASLYTPEDLLVVALSGCHMLTYLAEAARAGLLVLGYSDRAVGTMVLESTGGRFSSVVLRPEVVVAVGSDPGLALDLHRRAHADCFLANSMNFPVTHEPRIVIEGG